MNNISSNFWTNGYEIIINTSGSVNVGTKYELKFAYWGSDWSRSIWDGFTIVFADCIAPNFCISPSTYNYEIGTASV